MSVTIGFQTDSGSADPSYFLLAFPKDGKKYTVSDLIGDAKESDGQPANIPPTFVANTLQLTSPAQLSPNGTIVLNYPSGTTTLTVDRNAADVDTVITELYVTASA